MKTKTFSKSQWFFLPFAIILAICAARINVARSAEGIPLEDNPYWLHAEKACGPMCLAFLDRFFGRSRSYRDIAAFCSPGQEGVSMLALKQAAKKLGFHTLGFNGTTDELKRLKVPAILHCGREDHMLQHFVVLMGWNPSQKSFFVFDPPARLIEMKYKQMNDKFTGFGLAISNDPLTTQEDILMPSSSPFAWLIFGILGFDILVIFLACQFALKRRNGRQLSCGIFARIATIGTLFLVSCTPHVAKLVPTTETDDPYEIDMGTVTEGVVLRHTYTVTNSSDHPVRITGLRSL